MFFKKLFRKRLKLGLLLATQFRDNYSYNPFVPLGLGYLAANVHHKMSRVVEVVMSETVEEMILLKPDVVGISATTENYYIAIRYAQKIKAELGIPVILGGIHISLLPESLHTIFDLAVLGEGERTFVEVLQSIIKNKGISYDSLKGIPGLCFTYNGTAYKSSERSLIDNLDSLPPPIVESLPFYRPSKEACLVTSRGCPYKCSFCASEKFSQQYRSLSVKRIINDVAHLVFDKQITHIVFYDDLFIANKKRLQRIVEGLISRRIAGKCTFSCQVRANLVTPEICILLKKMGVINVGMGIESFSDKSLTFYNKQGVTAEMNQQALDLLWMYQIKVSGSFIFAAPGETKEDMLVTLRKVYENFKAGKLDNPCWSFLRPYPGTKIWDYAQEKGIVQKNMDWERFCDWSNFETYLCESVTKDQFIDMMDEWKTKYSLLLIDKGLTSSNFIITNPDTLLQFINRYKKKLIDRSIPEIGDELITKYELQLVCLSGWWPAEEGCWIGKTADFVIANALNSEYVTIQIYVPPIILETIYKNELEITISIHDLPHSAQVFKMQTRDKGKLDCKFNKHNHRAAHILIESSKSFIPKAHGLGPDVRELSVNIVDVF